MKNRVSKGKTIEFSYQTFKIHLVGGNIHNTKNVTIQHNKVKIYFFFYPLRKDERIYLFVVG